MFALYMERLSAEVQGREIRLGLRPVPAPVPAPEEVAGPQPIRARMPRKPREPLTWTRVIETLLSERTLQALLFLGAALLFAAAISLVVWNWEAFPPWLQVTFLALFTGVFYVMGWFVRVRMKLRGSGITLTAVGSLLAPLDFYAIYLSGGFPEELWVEVWLAASLVCMSAYILTVFLVQAEFFGYLVGLAAGSVLAAGLQWVGVNSAWWQTAWLGLALSLWGLGSLLDARLAGRWRILSRPFWRLAALGTAVVLALGTGWSLIRRPGDLTYTFIQAVNWWSGGSIFLLAARRYRQRTIALGALAAFPLSVWFTEAALFPAWGLNSAWRALGFSLLSLLYFWAGNRWQIGGLSSFTRDIGRLTKAAAWALMILAGLWSLLDAQATGIVHLVLAAALALAAALERRPRLSFVSSFLLVSGFAALATTRQPTLAGVGLAWGLLAVLHVIAALRITGLRTPQGALFAKPVFTAGWIIAALAVLPPLLAYDRAILAYALGNFAAINGWLALLAHHQARELLGDRVGRFGPRVLFYQWCAALAVLPWLWLIGVGRLSSQDPPRGLVVLGAAFAGLAWGLLSAAIWLRRYSWAYRLPWQMSAALSGMIAFGLASLWYDQPWSALILLLLGACAFAAAFLVYRPHLLILGGLIFPAGLMLGLDWLRLDSNAQLAPLALVPLVYVGAGAALSGKLFFRPRQDRRLYAARLYISALLVGLWAALWSLLRLAIEAGSDPVMAWSAAAHFLLALAAGWYAWQASSQASAHGAAWLGVYAGGLAALVLSSGTGRSTVLAALLAWIYVLAERALRHFASYNQITRRRRELSRRAWRLFGWPLELASWLVSAGTILLALIRNLVLLNTGRSWIFATVALIMVVGLYGCGAFLFRRRPRRANRLVWAAALAALLPWTMLTARGWYLWRYPALPDYAVSWLILALLEFSTAMALHARLGSAGRLLYRAPAVVAHGVAFAALTWGLGSTRVSVISIPLGIAFYGLNFAHDHWKARHGEAIRDLDRWLYAIIILLPLLVVYLLAYFAPQAPQRIFGMALLAFSLPALAAGRWLAQKARALDGRGYQRPLYALSYGTLLVGIPLLAPERPFFAGALLFGGLITLVSAWNFQDPLWLYPASGSLAGAAVLAALEWNLPPTRIGWLLIGLGGLQVLTGAVVRARGLRRPGQTAPESPGLDGIASLRRKAFAAPLTAAGFLLVAFGLPLSSGDRPGAIVAYAAAAGIYAFSAFDLRQPLLLAASVGLVFVPYWLVVLEINLGPSFYGLALWPGLLLARRLAAYFAQRFDWEPAGRQPPDFSWDEPGKWLAVLADRLLRWWAFPFWVAALVPPLMSWLLSPPASWPLALALALTAGLYFKAVFDFRSHFWLLAGLISVQFAVWVTIQWWDSMTPGIMTLPMRTLWFSPMVWLSALTGLWVERRLNEGPPLGVGKASMLSGWSRPFYVVVLADLFLSVSAGSVMSPASAWLLLSLALLVALAATAWAHIGPATAALVLGLMALVQAMRSAGSPPAIWPQALALLATVYGLAGYALRFSRRQAGGQNAPDWSAAWELPLRWAAWSLSGIVLFWSAALGVQVVRLAIRAFFGLPLLTAQDQVLVQMVVAVLALLGLFYLAAALTDRLRWLGYTAVAMLLSGWSLEWLLVWGMREPQWYAIPAGLYLLAVGYLEWRLGSREVARWLDRLALLLLLGSSFWQSLGLEGWLYALLMGMESLLILWWGSARRLRRFLYAGVAGVTIDVAGQLVEPLLSANRWIVFGVAGLILVSLAVYIERRLDQVMAFSNDVRSRLEKWD